MRRLAYLWCHCDDPTRGESLAMLCLLLLVVLGLIWAGGGT